MIRTVRFPCERYGVTEVVSRYQEIKKYIYKNGGSINDTKRDLVITD